MKRYIAIAFLLAGCANEPAKPSVLLPAGTKLILAQPTNVRQAFRNQVDYWNGGSVVLLNEPLLLTTP